MAVKKSAPPAPVSDSAPDETPPVEPADSSPDSAQDSSPDTEPETPKETTPAPEPDNKTEPTPPLIPKGTTLVDLLARKVLVDQNPALHPEVRKALADVAPEDLGDALSNPQLVQLNAALIALQAQVDAKPAPVTPPRAPVTAAPVPTVPAPPAAVGQERQAGLTLDKMTPADFAEFAKLL